MEYTGRNSSLRQPGESYIRQAAKEWIVWAAFKYMGPQAQLQWLYEYNAENILGVLKE